MNDTEDREAQRSESQKPQPAGDYAVGYGRPPERTRWKKGQSGNPKGRAKKQLNLKTDLLSELAETITVREGERPVGLTKQRALVKSLVARAIKGDQRAVSSLLALMVRLIEPEPIEEARALAPDDEAILQAFLARHGGKEAAK